MDPLQVTSRAIHDEPLTQVTTHDPASAEPEIKQAGLGPNLPDLEKQTTAVSASPSHAESYPEGGLAAWTVVLGAWFAMFSSLGLMNTLAVFQAYVLSHQLEGYSEGTVGWIFSVYTFLAFFCGVYIGPVFDKYGPKWLIVAGCVCVVLGVVLMSFCTGRVSPLHQQGRPDHV